MVLSADRPNTDPKGDLFGHAQFARHLAKSIQGYRGEEALVLALHGPWGSGKTTALGYVCHFVETSAPSIGDDLVIVHFNPWWFSGREDLTRAFLQQLKVVLPAKSEKLREVGSMLGKFAEGIGAITDAGGLTGGFGIPIGKLLRCLWTRPPMDVPALKTKIAESLKRARIRILVIVDDIDRLDDKEVRQLFTVVKAVADFPFVTYLLAFDRIAAASAIEKSSSLPGNRYLEKIVQVPFELPPVDKVALRAALSKRLSEVLAATPQALFNKMYWTNVYFGGIDTLIRTPRDIVRLTNTLSVTYPAVVGEVNVVDFVAMEAIRVFLPGLYDVIRANPHRFVGANDLDRSATDIHEKKAFHDKWAAQLPEDDRANAQSLAGRLFPKLTDVAHDRGLLSRWWKESRVCHPDVFPTYFRLSLPPASVGRQEMASFIGAASKQEAFAQMLLKAKEGRRPDGLSKVREFLERLMDYVEKDIPEADISRIVAVLFDVGDAVADQNDDQEMFDPGDASRIVRPIYHLVKRLPEEQRADVLRTAINSGKAIAAQCHLISALSQERTKATTSEATTLLDEAGVAVLKEAWLNKIRGISGDTDFLTHPNLAAIFGAWRSWGSDDDVRDWCNKNINTDDSIFRFLNGFLQYTKSTSLVNPAVQVRPRLSPSWLEPYINIATRANHLARLQQDGKIPDWASVAVSQFLKELAMIHNGKDPDAPDAFDGESSN